VEEADASALVAAQKVNPSDSGVLQAQHGSKLKGPQASPTPDRKVPAISATGAVQEAPSFGNSKAGAAATSAATAAPPAPPTSAIEPPSSTTAAPPAASKVSVEASAEAAQQKVEVLEAEVADLKRRLKAQEAAHSSEVTRLKKELALQEALAGQALQAVDQAVYNERLRWVGVW
jgi:hypothetical protein